MKTNPMTMSNYGYTKQVDYPFAEAVEKVKASLADQGFGILTEIDVKATMKAKLDKDVEDYMILGACNPHLAARAFEVEQEIGLLMPCNVIVYAKGGQNYISAMLPSVAMAFIGNPAMENIAAEAEPKMKTAIDNV